MIVFLSWGTVVAAEPRAAASPNAPDAPATPLIDPQADRLLRAMGEYLKMAEQFSVHTETTFDNVLPSGQKLQYTASIDVAVHRPNRLYAEYRGDLDARRFWYDGENVTLLSASHNVFARAPAKAQIEATLDYLLDEYGVSLPLTDLAQPDPYATLIENVQFGLSVGLHNVEGQRCHHLAFVEKYIDWQIWIEDGRQPLPRKLVITYKTVPGSPQFMAVFSDWDLTTRLADTVFVANPPADADQIEFLRLQDNSPAGAAGNLAEDSATD